ncbi:type-F conjugative transfer system secretin TraK [Cellvibrio sp.]|uniref:type-F conjugative transfer system secretin TraK n=1 Tax=Cellvibrio sp. TaxID=1965322 RepID=UPI0039647970
MNNIQLLSKWLVLLTIFSAGSPALAVQEFRAKDGATLSITISKNDLTRIAIQNGVTIERVWQTQGALDIQPDKKRGEIFVKPRLGSAEVVSFFVRDTAGATYTIIAKQSDIPSETVLITPLTLSSGKAGKADVTKLKSQPYVESIKALMKAMALITPLDSYATLEVNKNVSLWTEADIVLTTQYKNNYLAGEVYRITNKTEQDMQLDEREFTKFGDSVAAVAIENQLLRSGESTRFFIVRKIGEVR